MKLGKMRIGFAQEKSKVAPKDYPAWLQQFQLDANIDSLDWIKSLSEQRVKWAQTLEDHLHRTFHSIKDLSLIAFGIGAFLILVPFSLYFFSPPRDANLLWFSGLGIGETVAVLLYRPMQRMQNAISDMAQAIMILNSWATELSMALVDMKVDKDGEMERVSKWMSKITERHLQWFQSFTESKVREGSERVEGGGEAGKIENAAGLAKKQ
ncbi:MAG TPA: hypothetical protein VEO96_08700 [Thermoplasmata archaeon]|nr:hypothetical protein [Thermoplasmata archaeon]